MNYILLFLVILLAHAVAFVMVRNRELADERDAAYRAYAELARNSPVAARMLVAARQYNTLLDRLN